MFCKDILLIAIAFFGVAAVNAFSPTPHSSGSSSSSCHRRHGGLQSSCKPAFLPMLRQLDRSKGKCTAMLQSAAVSTVDAMGSSNSTTTSSGAAATANSTSDSSSTSSSSASSSSTERLQRKYDMPWGEFQEWAMKDHLEKYTVQVHIQNEEDGKDTLQVYTLWRTLSNDVTALSGYPLKFLVERYQEMRDEIKIETSTEILPYLDGFFFEPNGGVSGRAYGIAGVAKGTRIHTTPVAGVESTLQKGFILTQEGIVYELGLPASSSTIETIGRTTAANMAERAASSIQSVASSSSDVQLGDVVENQELAKLGALTAIVLSGAWAMEALSHHLTVNVFWV